MVLDSTLKRNLMNAASQRRVDFTEDRANLREIPEDASVRKPPLKRRSAAATVTNARE